MPLTVAGAMRRFRLTSRSASALGALLACLALAGIAVPATAAAAPSPFAWSTVPLAHDGPGNPIEAIACPSSSQCTAATHYGQAVTFDPASPDVTKTATVESTTVLGVACPSTKQCTMVDTLGGEVTFNPTTGAPNAIGRKAIDVGSGGKTYLLEDVACPTVTQCTAVDNAQGEVTFNPRTGEVLTGEPQLVETLGGRSLLGVACPTAARCTATDNAGNEVTFDPLTGDVNAAGVVNIDGTRYLYAVACPTTSQCTTVDSQGNEVTFDPADGSVNAAGVTNLAPNDFMLAVACPSATQCTAVNEGSEVTFDPTTGTVNAAGVQDLGNGGDGIVDGLACPTTSQCTAVDSAGRAHPFDPATGPTKPYTTVDRSEFMTAVSCVVAAQCTAMTYSGRAITFDPTRRSRNVIKTAQMSQSAVHVVSCPTLRQCTTAQGDDGEVTFDPRTGKPNAAGPKSLGFSGEMVGLSCPTARQCTAIDQPGDEVTFDPTTGHVNAAGVKAVDEGYDPTGLSCPTASQCTTVDRDGAEVTFDPATGAILLGDAQDVSGDHPLSTVSCPSRSRCTTVDNVGNEYTFDPTTGDVLRSKAVAGELDAVSCATATQCTAIGSNASAPTFHPTSAAPATPGTIPAASLLNDISCPSVDECVAVDAAGNGFVGLTVTARTRSAAGVTSSGATLRGIVQTGGPVLGWGFQFGRTRKYGLKTGVHKVTGGRARIPVAARVARLKPNARYHFRAVVIYRGNDGKVRKVYGADRSFRTKPNGRIRLVARKLNVREGRARIRLACASTARCAVRIAVDAADKTVCVRRSASVRANTRATVWAKLRGPCRARLEQAGTRALDARLTATTRSGQTGLVRRVVLER